jgi:hypothetical protein
VASMPQRPDSSFLFFAGNIEKAKSQRPPTARKMFMVVVTTIILLNLPKSVKKRPENNFYILYRNTSYVLYNFS